MTLLIKIRHFVCMVLVMCFTTTTVAWSAPDMSLSFSSLSVHSYDGLKTNPSQVLLLPKEIATVQKIYQSPNKKAPTLFHIQDAHASFQAQQNITNTLMHLVEEQKIDAIFVEGAMGRLDPKILSLDDNENDREKVIKKLKEYGVLGGIESFLLENEVKTFGVEEEKLYLQNLTDYRSAFALKTHAIKSLDQVKLRLMAEASKLFNAELYDFFKKFASNHENEKQWILEIDFLNREALKTLKVDFENARSQLDWPQLTRVAKLKKIGEEIDFKKAEKEKEDFIQDLTQMDLKEEATIFKTWTNKEAFKEMSKTSLRKYLEDLYLKNKSVKEALQIKQNFKKLLGHKILEEELDVLILAQEMKDISERIFERLVKNEEESKLLLTYQNILLVEKLLRLQLTYEDYREIKKMNDMNVFLKEQMESLTNSEILLKATATAENFYVNALQRDRVMFEKMNQKISAEKISSAVLITGGFHVHGIEERMQEEGYSYFQIAPHISEMEEDQTYEKILTLEGHDLLGKNTIDAPSSMDTALPAEYAGMYRGLVALARQEIRSFSEEPFSPVGRSELRANNEIVKRLLEAAKQAEIKIEDRDAGDLANALNQVFQATSHLAGSYATSMGDQIILRLSERGQSMEVVILSLADFKGLSQDVDGESVEVVELSLEQIRAIPEKEAWKIFEGLKLGPNMSLGTAKIAINRSLQWIEAQGFPNTSHFDYFRDVVDNHSSAIRSPKNHIMFSKGFSEKDATKPSLWINVTTLGRRLEAAVHLESIDFFMDVTSAMVREAAGAMTFDYDSKVTKAFYDHLGTIYGGRRNVIVQNGQDEAEMKAYLEDVQEDTLTWVTSMIASEIYEVMNQSAYLKWASDRSLYEIGRPYKNRTITTKAQRMDQQTVKILSKASTHSALLLERGESFDSLLEMQLIIHLTEALGDPFGSKGSGDMGYIDYASWEMNRYEQSDGREGLHKEFLIRAQHVTHLAQTGQAVDPSQGPAPFMDINKLAVKEYARTLLLKWFQDPRNKIDHSILRSELRENLFEGAKVQFNADGSLYFRLDEEHGFGFPNAENLFDTLSSHQRSSRNPIYSGFAQMFINDSIMISTNRDGSIGMDTISVVNNPNLIEQLQKYYPGLLELFAARYYQDLKDNETAVKYFRSAFEKDPYNYFIFKAYLELLAELKEYGEAIDVTQKILEINPAYLEGYGNLAELYSMAGHREKARAAFERYFEKTEKPTPKFVDDYLTLLDELKAHEDAVSFARRILAMNLPEIQSGELKIRLAQLLQIVGRSGEAQGLLEEVLPGVESQVQEDDNDLRMKGALIHAYYQQGRYVEARHLIEQALSKWPNHIRLLLDQVRVDVAMQSWQKALAVTDHALTLEMSDEERNRFMDFQVIALTRQGDVASLKEAEKIMSAIVDGAPNNSLNRLRHGNILMEMDRYDEAEAAYQRALDLLGENNVRLIDGTDTRFNLFDSLGRLNRARFAEIFNRFSEDHLPNAEEEEKIIYFLEQSELYFQQALEMKPQDINMLYALAETQTIMERYDDAAITLVDWIEVMEDRERKGLNYNINRNAIATTYQLYAHVLFELGRDDEAEEMEAKADEHRSELRLASPDEPIRSLDIVNRLRDLNELDVSGSLVDVRSRLKAFDGGFTRRGVSLRKEDILIRLKEGQAIINEDQSINLQNVQSPWGKVNLTRLNNISTYQGPYMLYEIARDIEVAHLLGLINLSDYVSGVGLKTLKKVLKKQIPSEALKVELSWQVVFELQKNARNLSKEGVYEGALDEKNLKLEYRETDSGPKFWVTHGDEERTELEDADEAQVYFLLAHEKVTNFGSAFSVLPRELKNTKQEKGKFSWSKLNMNRLDAAKQFGIQVRSELRLVEEYAAPIWVAQEVAGQIISEEHRGQNGLFEQLLDLVAPQIEEVAAVEQEALKVELDKSNVELRDLMDVATVLNLRASGSQILFSATDLREELLLATVPLLAAVMDDENIFVLGGDGKISVSIKQALLSRENNLDAVTRGFVSRHFQFLNSDLIEDQVEQATRKAEIKSLSLGIALTSDESQVLSVAQKNLLRMIADLQKEYAITSDAEDLAKQARDLTLLIDLLMNLAVALKDVPAEDHALEIRKFFLARGMNQIQINDDGSFNQPSRSDIAQYISFLQSAKAAVARSA